MVTTGWAATKPTASCTASCRETERDCDCHPEQSAPSYSTIDAPRRGSPERDATALLAGQRFYETRGFLFLAGGSFLHDFFKDGARAFGIAHVHVSASQIELRAHLAHGHRLQFRNREIQGLELVRLNLDAIGRGGIGAVHRLADIEVDLLAALAGL